MARILRYNLSGTKDKFPWQEVPRAEGERNQAVGDMLDDLILFWLEIRPWVNPAGSSPKPA